MTIRYYSSVLNIQIVVKNSLDPDPDPVPDSDFWLDPDPDSINMDPKHWYVVSSPADPDPSGSAFAFRMFVYLKNVFQLL